MGSVAVALKRRGYHITGSDSQVYPPMSSFLEENGIAIAKGFSADNLPQTPHCTIVVGNAISRKNPELEALLSSRAPYTSLPALIKDHFLWAKRNFVITGTHGKTTTSSLLTWIFKEAQLNPSHLIGGVPAGMEGGCAFTDSSFCVLEGDEYDTAFFDKRSKFLHYLPEVAILNNIEFDHADIFDSLEDITKSFSHLLRIIPANGLILANADCPNVMELVKNTFTPVQTVGMHASSYWKIEAIETIPADLLSQPIKLPSSRFLLNGQSYTIPLAGEFNVRNAAMSIAAAHFAGVKQAIIAKALRSFGGVKRRQQLRGIVNQCALIDDFAHHPTAITQALQSLRACYPQSRIWAIFEPRSNTTKRKIFEQPLAKALAYADRAVIASLPHPEKIPPDQRLNTHSLVHALNAASCPAFLGESTASIVDYVVNHSRPGDLFVVLSNGGFDGIHDKILDALKPN